MAERIIPLTGAANVRDLGGYQNKAGQFVRFKKVVRGAAISDLTAEDASHLEAYGIVKVVDFRSSKEQEKAPDALIPQAENIFLPIFQENQEVSAAPKTLMEQVEAGLDAAQQMREVYRQFVQAAYSRQAYRQFIDILLENEQPDQGVLFHCTAGKDRTGFGAALILAMLDVDQETILQNYLETNQQMVTKRAEMLQQAQQAGASEAMLKGIQEVMQADQSYLAESFATIGKEYGDVSGYLQNGLGLSKRDLTDFRKLYTVVD